MNKSILLPSSSSPSWLPPSPAIATEVIVTMDAAAISLATITTDTEDTITELTTAEVIKEATTTKVHLIMDTDTDTDATDTDTMKDTHHENDFTYFIALILSDSGYSFLAKTLKINDFNHFLILEFLYFFRGDKLYHQRKFI
jgi:hypothetical protein